jgi:outer membrane receptor protein involved in Fe transport
MSADKILVLVNGKRRHRSALVQLSGDGVHGPDLATIPSIALKSVEVLRDGASAMYGSDAIAGVFNFNLRDSAEGGEVRLQTGMYTEGNERGYLLQLNQGVRLGQSGFINISAELSDNEPTSRGTFFTTPWGFSTLEVAQVSGFFDHDLNPATPDQQRFGPDALTEIYDPPTLVTQTTSGLPRSATTNWCRYGVSQTVRQFAHLLMRVGNLMIVGSCMAGRITPAAIQTAVFSIGLRLTPH